MDSMPGSGGGDMTGFGGCVLEALLPPPHEQAAIKRRKQQNRIRTTARRRTPSVCGMAAQPWMQFFSTSLTLLSPREWALNVPSAPDPEKRTTHVGVSFRTVWVIPELSMHRKAAGASPKGHKGQENERLRGWNLGRRLLR